ncbi:MAG: metallophosphoesterase [Nitriliruptorales bacterium]|nr:metallophosphoesterase [Nitriliruptorales bacterium]
MEPFRFIFMADCQLGCYASFSGLSDDEVTAFAQRGMTVSSFPKVAGFDWDAANYRRAIAQANEIAPDFVVMGGDMVDDPFDEGQYEAVREITEDLRSRMFWVPGNHDAGDDTDHPTARSLAHYRERFGPDHYAFEHKGASFIVVNTVVWSHAEMVPAEWEEQLAALEQSLAEARERGGPIIVFGHHPLFLRDPQEADDFFNVPRVRRDPLLDLLADHGVTAYFCGHWHRNGGGTHRGVEVVISGAVGFPLGDDPSGLRIVDVGPDGLSHTYVALDTDE